MKTKLLTFFFAFFAITSLYAQTSGTCGETLKWSFNYSDGTLTITGKGDMTNWKSSSAVPWESYKKNIKNISFPANITSIGDYAFHGCKELKSVVIPEKVTAIGQYAFNGCSRLDSVVIPENVTTIKIFAFTNSVKSVTLNSNKFISKDYETTSNNCKYIFGDQVRNYTFGPNVTKIGKYAFSRCTNLDEIVIPNNIQTIGLYAFENCSIKSVTIGTGISDCTFGGCDKLKTVEINSDKFFRRSNANIAGSFGTQVEKFIIGDSVTYLCKFDGCTQMNTLVIGKNVTEIVDISNCPSLTSLTIPENVVSIGGKGAFEGNTNLKSIVWNAKNVSTTMYSTSAPFYEIGSQIESFIIGDSVEAIPNYLCYKMSNITYISFPNRLRTIQEGAFWGCAGLTCPIIIPDSVTYIGKCAFWECSNIPSVIIGDRVTKINRSTFSGCSKLSSITIGKSVSHVDETAFFGCMELRSVVWNAINCDDFIRDKTPFYNKNVTDYHLNLIMAKDITSFTFGEEVQTIPAYLCYNMSLNEIVIPSNVISLRTNAFTSIYRSYGVVHFLGIVTYLASDIGREAASYSPIYVPCGSLDYYRERIKGDPKYILNYPSQYSINLTTDSTQGSVASNIEPSVCDSAIEISAIPNEGYHFTQWSDSITDNPRTIILNQDTTISAEFAINRYFVSVVCDSLCGSIDGESGEFNYNTMLSYTANAKEGYHFVEWSDGITDNPRTIILDKDTAISAEFAINRYYIVVTCNSQHGYIEGENGFFNHGTELTYQAFSKEGFYFTNWSDGETSNPRTIILYENTNLRVDFAKYKYNVQFFGFYKNLIDSQNVEYGSAATAPNVPDIENYHFVCWDKDFTNITSDLDVYAIYQENIEGVESITIDSLPYKIMYDGKIFIRRGDKTYTLQGQEVNNVE